MTLDPNDAAVLREHAAAADAAGALQAPQLDVIHRTGWLKMLAPRAYGGTELPLPQAVRLEEAIAAADGSAGWVATLCAGAGWFAGFLAPELARRVVATPQVCLAGSGAAAGQAVREGDGWRVTGQWAHASGSRWATHFTLNAVLGGSGAVRSFIVPAAQVRVLPTWHCIGMRATASNSYAIDGAWVPDDHAFEIRPEAATVAGPLYRFPFVSLAYVTLAANLAGIAMRFVELAHDVVPQRRHLLDGSPLAQNGSVRDALRSADARLRDQRAAFHDALDAAWSRVVDGATLDDKERNLLMWRSMDLVDAARRAVDGLYPLAGLHAADARSEMNRVWRDFHTATQHGLLVPA